MALLSQGGAEPGRVGCPACGTLMRLADVHSAAALAATSKAALPPHLRAAVLEIQRGGEGGASEVTKGQPSSKIRRLMEVRTLPPATALASQRCNSNRNLSSGAALAATIHTFHRAMMSYDTRFSRSGSISAGAEHSHPRPARRGRRR